MVEDKKTWETNHYCWNGWIVQDFSCSRFSPYRSCL